jgi:hypothetical protein
MAMTYSNLVDSKSNTESVAYWVNSTILPVTSILTDAQAFIYSQLRVREMRGYAGLSIVVGASFVDLPTGFLGPIVMLDQYGTKIRLFEESMLWRSRAFDTNGALQRGPISRYAIFDEKAQFDVGSDVVTTFSYIYYKLPTALGTGNETNFLTTRYPHLLRQACIAMAYAFLKDFEGEKNALAKVVSFIQSANEESDLSRFGGDYPVEDMRDG